MYLLVTIIASIRLIHVISTAHHIHSIWKTRSKLEVNMPNRFGVLKFTATPPGHWRQQQNDESGLTIGFRYSQLFTLFTDRWGNEHHLQVAVSIVKVISKPRVQMVWRTGNTWPKYWADEIFLGKLIKHHPQVQFKWCERWKSWIHTCKYFWEMIRLDNHHSFNAKLVT